MYTGTTFFSTRGGRDLSAPACPTEKSRKTASGISGNRFRPSFRPQWTQRENTAPVARALSSYFAQRAIATRPERAISTMPKSRTSSMKLSSRSDRPAISTAISPRLTETIVPSKISTS